MKKFVIGFLLATFSICVFLASLPVRADSTAPGDEEIEPYAFPTFKVLGVPVVGQKREFECWAACGSSICRYFGYSVSKDQFAILTGITDNRMATFQDMIPTFNRYGLTPTEVSTPFNFGSVQVNICNNADPIIANVYLHAIIVDGYSSNTSQKLRCMDPDKDGQYIYLDHFDLADPNGNGYPDPNDSERFMRWYTSLYNF